MNDQTHAGRLERVRTSAQIHFPDLFQSFLGQPAAQTLMLVHPMRTLSSPCRRSRVRGSRRQSNVRRWPRASELIRDSACSIFQSPHAPISLVLVLYRQGGGGGGGRLTLGYVRQRNALRKFGLKRGHPTVLLKNRPKKFQNLKRLDRLLVCNDAIREKNKKRDEKRVRNNSAVPIRLLLSSLR